MEWRSTPKPTKVRIMHEEEVNRDGHWAREFSFRSEAWPLIEHWASEAGYHLIAMKGGRRLYAKGDSPAIYQTFLEIKQFDNRVKVAAWIRAGFWVRLFYCFFLGAEFNPEPHGFKAVRFRRQVCRDLNGLLMRLRQPLIAGVDSFHVADWDMTVLVLWAALCVPLLGVLLSVILKMEIRWGLSNPMLAELGRRAGTLLSVAIGLLVAQGYAARRFERPVSKVGTAVASFILFTTLSVFMLTRAGREFEFTKMSHYCLAEFQAPRCRDLLQRLSPEERAALAVKLRQFGAELAVKPKP